MKRCRVCGAPRPHRHHIYSRGAYGQRAETEANIIHLCARHHAQAHDMGRDTFMAHYLLTHELEQARAAIHGG